MIADAELANVDAYDRWAPSYPPHPHNPLMQAEQQAVLELWPEVAGLRALDLACGTGRYARLLQQRGAAIVVGADASAGMLMQAGIERRVRADMMRLPFAADAFDFVVAGLAVGHAPDLQGWMHEVARVLAPGGCLVFSDFHPQAARAGMTRSFTDGEQRQHHLAHRLYDLAEHRAAAGRAGLVLEAGRELRVGLEFRESFAGSDDFHRRWHGLPLLLAARARKP